MKKNIFVVGLDDFHIRLLQTVDDADRYAFYPLLDAAEIVNPVDCRISEVLLSAKQTLDAFPGTIDAIIGHWDFPTSTLLPILRRHCGLAGPSLEAVLRCEHKYWSRLEQQRIIPEYIPKFSAFDPFAMRPREGVNLDYPFWIKPVKAHSSFLGFRIENDADFECAIDEIRRRIAVVALPFNEILSHASLPPEIQAVDGWHCIAEEIIATDMQCTVEGYALKGDVRGYGYIDSERGGRHRSSFVRYHYPSRLPASVHARMEDVARKFLRAVGFDQSAFNMEFFYDEERDTLFLVEVNTRISKSHCPLFLFVDGASHHQITIKVSLGEDPEFPQRQGDFAHAAKFMMRHLGPDGVVAQVPRAEDVLRLQEHLPELMMNLHVRKDLRLSDLALQEPYSYELADIFLGAESSVALEERYERCRRMMPIAVRPLSTEPAEEHRRAL